MLLMRTENGQEAAGGTRMEEQVRAASAEGAGQSVNTTVANCNRRRLEHTKQTHLLATNTPTSGPYSRPASGEASIGTIVQQSAEGSTGNTCGSLAGHTQTPHALALAPQQQQQQQLASETQFFVASGGEQQLVCLGGEALIESSDRRPQKEEPMIEGAAGQQQRHLVELQPVGDKSWSMATSSQQHLLRPRESSTLDYRPAEGQPPNGTTQSNGNSSGTISAAPMVAQMSHHYGQLAEPAPASVSGASSLVNGSAAVGHLQHQQQSTASSMGVCAPSESYGENMLQFKTIQPQSAGRPMDSLRLIQEEKFHFHQQQANTQQPLQQPTQQSHNLLMETHTNGGCILDQQSYDIHCYNNNNNHQQTSYEMTAYGNVNPAVHQQQQSHAPIEQQSSVPLGGRGATVASNTSMAATSRSSSTEG